MYVKQAVGEREKERIGWGKGNEGGGGGGNQTYYTSKPISDLPQSDSAQSQAHSQTQSATEK